VDTTQESAAGGGERPVDGDQGEFRRLRAVVEVVAGMLPGKDPEPSLTRRFPIFEDEWAAAHETTIGGSSSSEATILMAERQGQALGYAQLLMLQQWNWVRVDWIWM
jgi:hypothetical protein